MLNDLSDLKSIITKIRSFCYFPNLQKNLNLSITHEDLMKEIETVESLKMMKAMLLESVSDIDSIISKREAFTSFLSLSHRRLYLVRRLALNKENPPSWSELDETGQLWNRNNLVVEEVCRSVRDKNNKNENSERPNVKGWLPGKYVWQMWAYDPNSGLWSILD